MIEDRELDIWREQWSSVAEPLPDMRGVIHNKINRQNRWFLISNLAAVVAAIGGVIFAIVLWRKQSYVLGKAQAIGIIVLIALCSAYRIWVQRGTWRPETQTTRAFVELWRRRVMAKIRALRVAMFVAPAWTLFCIALFAANWKALGPDVKAHPAEWWGVLVGAALMTPGLILGLGWYRRRKQVELGEVNKILHEMDDNG